MSREIIEFKKMENEQRNQNDKLAINLIGIMFVVAIGILGLLLVYGVIPPEVPKSCIPNDVLRTLVA